MAKKRNETLINTKKISNMMSSLNTGIDRLYTNTHFSSTMLKKDTEMVKKSIDKSIDKIIGNNIEQIGVPNISKLYGRMGNNNSDSSDQTIFSAEQLEDVFNDKALTESLMPNFLENKLLKSYEEEIDSLCKYMPSLEDALDAKKDNVLSADHFSKDYLNIICESEYEQKEIATQISNIKTKYNLLKRSEEWYDRASKYGECFVYAVDYNKAFKKLLTNKTNTSYVQESFNMETIINESTFNKEEFPQLNVEFRKDGIIESCIKEQTNIKLITEKAGTTFDKIIKDDVKFEGLESIDGFIDKNKVVDNPKLAKIPGCIVKELERTNVLPIYIEETCLGYYYLECNFDRTMEQNTLNDPMIALKRNTSSMEKTNTENMLKFISNKLSNMIDSNFINANQDLSQEIYIILQANDIMNSNITNANLRISYIAPDDLIHIHFNMDNKTHRGKSDLDKAMLPAKMYSCLYSTNAVGMITRGFDKRVYYVKQQVDTNISQLLLNTISQIRKGNFGAREFGNFRNMMNITGRYNDLVIPLSATGDSPVQFEMMPGQNIDPKTEFLDILEQMAINSTDVPYEYVQSRKNVDYAVRLTMSSGKFLRKTFKRQGQYEYFLDKIINKIWLAEGNDPKDLTVMLPPPSFLNLLQTNEIFGNVNALVEQIVSMECDSEENADELRAVYTKKLKYHYLSSYLDIKAIKSLKQEAEMEVKTKHSKSEQQ